MMDRRLRRSLFLRSLLLQACWSFESMQAVGFAWCMDAWLRRLYPRVGERREALARHMEYFNTQPYMAAFVIGVVGSMEERLRGAGEAERVTVAKRISALKKAFGAALAGIGDAFFWATLKPFCAALAMIAWLALWTCGFPHPIAAVALLYLAAYNAPVFWVRWRGLSLGYELGEGVVAELQRLRWQDKIRALRWAGLALAAALAVSALLVPPWGANPARINVVLLAACLAGKARGMSTPRLYGLATAAGVLAAAAGIPG